MVRLFDEPRSPKQLPPPPAPASRADRFLCFLLEHPEIGDVIVYAIAIGVAVGFALFIAIGGIVE